MVPKSSLVTKGDRAFAVWHFYKHYIIVVIVFSDFIVDFSFAFTFLSMDHVCFTVQHFVTCF